MSEKELLHNENRRHFNSSNLEINSVWKLSLFLIFFLSWKGKATKLRLKKFSH